MKMKLGKVDVEIDAEGVVDSFTVRELMDYIGEGEFLDEIGQDAAVEHFGLELAE